MLFRVSVINCQISAFGVATGDVDVTYVVLSYRNIELMELESHIS